MAAPRADRATGFVAPPDPQACDPRIVAAIAKEAKVDLAVPDILVTQACKPFPSRPHTLIAAVGLRRSVDIVDIHLALWNEHEARIEARGVEPIEEDAALELDKVAIDTARYRLGPDVRAFAIDTDGYSQVSCPDGGFGPQRRLFVQDGVRVRRVLGPIDLSTWWMLSSGNDMCHHAEPEPPTIIETYATTLALGNETSHGYRDLVVTVVASRGDDQPSALAPLVHTLRYDGREYPTLSLETAYWNWRDGDK